MVALLLKIKRTGLVEYFCRYLIVNETVVKLFQSKNPVPLLSGSAGFFCRIEKFERI
jgi:hypothetical protein